MSFSIQRIESPQPTDNLLVISNSTDLLWAGKYLTTSEQAYLAHAAKQAINYVFFPKETQGILVHFVGVKDNAVDQKEANRRAGNEIISAITHYRIDTLTILNKSGQNHLAEYVEGMVKPSQGSLDMMKCDMAGAATVIGAMVAVAKAKLPIHLIALVPATDNRLGNDAYLPGDVITMYDGTTVEVLNTDAEGRLILADALHYAKKYDPELVLDFATLTGAAVRSLGQHAICYMGTADKVVKSNLENSGEQVYERLVEFPLWKEYGNALRSNVADLKNIGGPTAGQITAGKFLQHFTDYPWLHFDIAGPAFLRAADSYRTKEGTGVGVRLIFDFLRSY